MAMMTRVSVASPISPEMTAATKQDEDHEIFELLDEHAEQRPLAPFGEHVGAVLGKAASHLLMAEAVWRRLQVVEDSVNRHGVPERHTFPLSYRDEAFDAASACGVATRLLAGSTRIRASTM
jgi:hypothetical protein